MQIVKVAQSLGRRIFRVGESTTMISQPGSGIPCIILDDPSAACTPVVGSLNASNVDAAVSALLSEIAQPGYNAVAALRTVQNKHLNVILLAMNDVLDDGEDVTFEAVREALQEDLGISITPQEYLDASQFNFSL